MDPNPDWGRYDVGGRWLQGQESNVGVDTCGLTGAGMRSCTRLLQGQESVVGVVG